jgi:hypothetical protein
MFIPEVTSKGERIKPISSYNFVLGSGFLMS